MAQTVRAHAMPHTRSRDRVAPMFVQVFALLEDKFAYDGIIMKSFTHKISRQG